MQSGAILLALIYLAPLALIFLPYDNWIYARSHGWSDWASGGFVRAIGKALGWPYFAFFAPIQGPAMDGAMNEQRFASIKASYVARLTAQCEASFAAREPWTLKIAIGREVFCPCFAVGLFDAAPADRPIGPGAPSGEIQTRAALIELKCAGGQR